MASPLPNFLIIGAGRSGTTSLYEYLRQHPDVFMSDVKEPSYFAFMDGGLPVRGQHAKWVRRNAVTTRDGYEKLFASAGSAKAIGEASPIYLSHSAVADRIRSALPDVRLIAMLRNPVERAYAGWLGLRRDGNEPTTTFERALSLEEARLREGWSRSVGLVGNGMYYQLLSRYYDRFPREQIRVFLFEDLVRDVRAVVRDVFRFLGVDESFMPDTSHKFATTGLVRNPFLRLAWTHSYGPRQLVRPLLPRRWRDAALAWATSDLVKPTLAPATRAALVERLRGDIVALQALIGRDLSGWLNPPP